MAASALNLDLSGLVLGQPRVPDPIYNALTSIQTTINSLGNVHIAADAAIDPSKIDFGDTGAQSTLGYASTTTATTGITTGSDLTGLSVTVTVPAGGRRVRITALARFQGGINDASHFLYINEGGTTLQEASIVNRIVSNRYTVMVQHVLTPTAGSHTYKVVGSTSSGTTATAPAATYPDFIHVELI